MHKSTDVINIDNVEIIYVPINKIIPYDNNPKLHSDRDIEKLIKSMTVVKGRIIFHQPISLDRENVVIAGHGRRLAALKLELPQVPCTYLDVSKEEAIALRLADNEAFGLEYDLAKLEEELNKLNNSQKYFSDIQSPDVDKLLSDIQIEQARLFNKTKKKTPKESIIDDIDGTNLDEIDDDIEDHPKEKRLETVLCEDLSLELNGTTEVKTPIGYIDIMTKTEIIEVKRVRKWKWALGQILVYGLYHPSHGKRIHLFGRCKESKLEIIKEHCEKFDVTVTWQYEEFRP